MIRCTITIEIGDDNPQGIQRGPRLWRAVVDAATEAARMAAMQHDNVTAPPLDHAYNGESFYGDAIGVKVVAK